MYLCLSQLSFCIELYAGVVPYVISATIYGIILLTYAAKLGLHISEK